MAVALGLAAWVLEASCVADEGGDGDAAVGWVPCCDGGGSGDSSVVWVTCCDGGGASEDAAGGLVEPSFSSVAVPWPLSLSESGVGSAEGEGSTLLASAVYVFESLKAGTPGNMLMGAGCGARLTSTG